MNKIEIVELLMARAGTYNTQYRRPYQTTGTAQAVNMISERLDSLNGHVKNITGGLLAGVAADFVAPTAAPESNAGIIIPNGWGTDRYFFFMRVRVYNAIGGYSTELIQGYTEHPEIISMSGSMDPHARFYINSVTSLTESLEYRGHQPERVSRVADAYHVVTNNTWTDITALSDPSSQNFTCMRPGDIYTSLSSQASGMTGDLVDFRTLSTKTPRASRRSNSLSTDYASQVINGTLQAASRSMFGTEDSELYLNAIGLTIEQPLSKNAFISAISAMNNIPISDTFTASDLFRLDPNLANPMDDRMKVFTSSGASPMQSGGLQHRAEFSEQWGGASHENLASAMIANAITGLMIEAGLAVAHIQATNHNIGGPVIRALDAQGLAGQDVRAAMMGFQARLQSEVIDHISYHNQISYNIEIRGEIARATMISLQFEQRPMMTFVAPSFADALTAPVLTSNMEQLHNVAFDFGNMLGAVIQTPTPTLESLVQGTSGFEGI